MKKVISTLLSLTFFISIIPKEIVEAKKIESIDLKSAVEYKLINGLGAIPEEIAEIAEAEAIVTRGDFAAIIHSIAARNAQGKDTNGKSRFGGRIFSLI